jgi:uncharacterized protein (DUF433 family)
LGEYSFDNVIIIGRRIDVKAEFRALEGVEHDLERASVLFLQRVEPSGPIGKRGEHLPKPDERALDCDVDQDGSLATWPTPSVEGVIIRATRCPEGTTAMTTAELEPLSVVVPLREEPAGVFRVGKSRVLLELVIGAFQRGETPEAIVQSYDTLSLPDVYVVVGYYLANPEPIDEYLRQRDEAAADTRRKIEAAQPPRADLRERVMARARATGLLRDQAGD